MSIESDIRAALSAKTNDKSTSWHYFSVGQKVKLDGTDATCIEDVDDVGYEDSGPVYKIVEFEGRYFKKSGYKDSYDDATWDGELVEVERIKVDRFDYKEIKR